MSWPNLVQILSFASMAPSQVVRKHDYVAKVAGGCSSYDVIAPWPDLTRSIFFAPKIAQDLPHKVAQNPAALRAAVFFFRYPRKTSWGLHQPPPLYGRGLKARNQWCWHFLDGIILLRVSVNLFIHVLNQEIIIVNNVGLTYWFRIPVLQLHLWSVSMTFILVWKSMPGS